MWHFVRRLCILVLCFAAVTKSKDLTLKEVRERNLNHLVVFHSPQCGHCKQLMPEIAKLEKSIGYTVVKKINCLVNEDICRRFNIRGYPTIIHYAPDLNNPGTFTPSEYTQKRDARSIAEFVKKSFKSPLVRIVTGDKLSRRDVTYQEFMDLEKKKLHCVYLTDSEVAPPLFLMSLCSKFAKSVVMAFSGESRDHVSAEMKHRLRGKAFLCARDGTNVKSCGGLEYSQLEKFLNDELEAQQNKKAEL